MTAIAEKYARALGSSHLVMKSTDLPQGAIETLIAAGSVKDSLGVGLLRLRAEFDSIATMPGARNMLPRLKSAASVRNRMLALVMDRGGPMGDEAVEIVAKLLDEWCSSNCPTCDGRGSIGGYGAPQSICTTCGGSKRRRIFWSDSEEGFACMIADQMVMRVDKAERKIRRLLRQD